jgi:opacity protein-like surface antigen
MFNLSKIAIAACAMAATALPAKAAEIVPYEPVPIPPAVVGGWYLRGDIGYSNREVDDLDNVLFDTTETFDIVHSEFTGAPFVAAGLGHRINN